MVTTEDKLAAVEAHFGLELPALYRRMHLDGACDYGASPEEWRATFEARMFDRPPALLGALDFEWLTLDRMLRWRAPAFWLPDPGLLPFGQTGRGDKYAFVHRWAAGERVPVVLAYRDVNEAHVLAPDLEAFLYRQMLEAFTFPPSDGEFTTAADERRARRASVAALRPYMRDVWTADLEALTAREPREWRQTGPRFEEVYLALLDETELNARLRRELAFERLDMTFPYMNP